MWLDGEWVPVGVADPVVTGGTITEIDGYKVHTFTSSGNLVVESASVPVEFVLVAAGGGAHSFGGYSGGGGGGGVIEWVPPSAGTFGIYRDGAPHLS